MAIIIDRRTNGRHKSSVNRARFIDRQKRAVKEAVKESIANGSITDIGKKGATVRVKKSDLIEPTFRHDFDEGIRHGVNPGNKKYIKGDIINSDDQGGGSGGGNGAGNGGEGEDDFVFTISKDEFLNIFFEDLELPNLANKTFGQAETFEWTHAGYSTIGVPANLSIVRSMRQSLGRRIAMRGPIQKKIDALEEELNELILLQEAGRATPNQLIRLEEVTQALSKQRSRKKHVPFLDDIDLRYRIHKKVPKPITRAVMVCLMDVSGSMTQTHKEYAKRFYMLLYFFLQHKYKHVEVRFVRHTHMAMECDEETFFYGRESGGTVVSEGLKVVQNILRDYGDGTYNCYVAQCSDGDNWENDNKLCEQILTEQILPNIQYYTYIEIEPDKKNMDTVRTDSIYHLFSNLEKRFYDRLSTGIVAHPTDIYTVFRKLFERKE